MMRVIGVLDLMDGVVVRGIAGRREAYRPIVTPLSPTPEPIAVANAFRDRFGLREIYIADLDAIAGRPPRCELYRTLQQQGFSLWVDAGLRKAADAVCLHAAGVDRIVIGLETIGGPDEVTGLLKHYPATDLVFSLDLRGGRTVMQSNGWDADPLAVVRQAVDRGMRTVIVLDMAHVGLNEGTGNESLCRQLVQAFPAVAFYAGGGVRGLNDLLDLQRIGFTGALVASALHDGRLSRPDLDTLAHVSG